MLQGGETIYFMEMGWKLDVLVVAWRSFVAVQKVET